MKILFVCSSNICRSPYAEMQFRRLVAQSPVLSKNVEWIQSGAVLNHCNDIHGKARAALLADGFSADEIAAHRPAHQNDQPRRFDEADVIIGMTRSHKLFLKRKWKAKYVNLSEATGKPYQPIPDPWLIRSQDRYNAVMHVILDYLQQYADYLETKF